ncbi:hypothetical protein BJX61DRAFT_252531 [Aspergillus egyptiacus]|nr:hypothetical protein BJX61DRAFT_252531 [Aspergillus egyptiacus]
MLGGMSSDDCPRSIVAVLNDPDIVLTFVSIAFIRGLYYRGSNSATVLDLDGPHSCLLNQIRSHENVAECFCSYIRAERQRFSSTGGSLPTCYLLESDKTHASTLRRGPVVLIFSDDRIVFIHCSKKLSGYGFDYATLRPAAGTKTKCLFAFRPDGRKPRLSIHIHPEDSFTVNDQNQNVQTLSFRIITNNDMENIQRMLETFGIRCQTQHTGFNPMLRRSSSLVIPLDTAEEISQENPESSEKSSHSVMDRPAHGIHWRNKASDPIKQSDGMSGTAAGNTSPSSLSELTQTPTLHVTSSPRVRDSSHVATPRLPGINQTDKGQSAAPNVPDNTQMDNDAMDPPFSNTQNTENAISQLEDQASYSGPAGNTRSRASQNAETVPSTMKLKPIPPNTQESLIFPRRRTKGKLYTAQSKKTVDGDEDLRESDSSVKRKAGEDTDLTSVSSPSPNATDCPHNLRSRMRGSAKRKSGGKARKQVTKRKKGVRKRSMNKKTKPFSPSLESVKTESRKNSFAGTLQEQKIEPDLPEHEDRSSPFSENMNGPNDLSLVPNGLENASHQTSNASSSQERFSCNAQAEGGQTNDNVSHDGAEETCRAREYKVLGHATDEQYPVYARQGRGQNVAQKLIAALREIDTSGDYNDHGRETRLEIAEPDAQTVSEPSRGLSLFADADQRVDHGPDESREDAQCISLSSSPRMIQKGSAPEESYHSSLSESGKGSLEESDTGIKNSRLGKRASLFETDDGGERKRTRRTSSLITSSSVEPQSTQSTFGSCYTGSQIQPRDHDRVPRKFTEDATSSKMLNGTSGFLGQASTAICAWDESRPGRISVDSYREELQKGSPDSAANCPTSNPRTIVDKNGSPRLLKNEHGSPKRRPTSPTVEQAPSVGRKSKSNQEDNHALKEDVTRYGDRQAEDDHPSTGCTIMNDKPRITPHKSEKSAQEPGEREVETVSEVTLPGSESSSPFLYRLGGNNSPGCLPKGSRSVSGSSLTGQLRARGRLTSAKEDHGEKLQGPAAGRSPGAESKLKVARGLPEDTAGQIEWQTSLQELHRGMQKTLANTREQITRQMESERTTVNKALEIYRNQCHKVLDRVFSAQMERIRLCKQQMDSIKQQHADICQGLICRLEEDERSLIAVWESQ